MQWMTLTSYLKLSIILCCAWVLPTSCYVIHHTGPASTTNPTQFSYNGMIKVTPGNIIAASLGEDAHRSRAFCFDIAQEVIQNCGAQLGFDERYHKLVIPRPPYKPGTTEHWPDKGMHVTIALQSNLNHAGANDMITDALTAFHGRLFKVGFDTSAPMLLLGKPENDVAVGAAYYLVVKVDAETAHKISTLRQEMGLAPLKETFVPHVTLAGIAPANGDFYQFRRRWCVPYPTTGLPAPLRKLAFNGPNTEGLL